MKKCLLMTIVCFFFSISIFATDQVVTNNNDAGAGSLRQAIIDAGDGDQITFNLSFGNETITISSELSLTESLIIEGSNSPGSGTAVTVQVTTPGTSTFRVFNINASGKTITLSNMTIKGGDISGNGNVAAGFGGGIYLAAGTLTLEKATVSNSQAYNGGGIYVGSAILNLNNSSVISNTIDENISGAGAGIYTSGTTNITNSTIALNTGPDYGGGIFINSGTTTIRDATISQNKTNGTNDYGGGIYHQNGTLDIKNTIIANNYLLNVSSATNGSDYYQNSGTLTNNDYNVVGYSDDKFQNDNDIWYDFNAGYWTNINTGANIGTIDLATSLSYSGGFTETLPITGGGFLSASEGAGSTTETTDQRGYYRKSGTVYTGTTPTTTANYISRGAFQYNGVVARDDAGSWSAGADYYTHIKGAAKRESSGTIVLAGTAIYEYGIDLDDSESITIQGAGATSTIVQAATTRETASDRVFTITDGIIVLEDMAIKHGYPADDAYYGGGIYSNATALTINDCIISGNEDYWNEYGGGIYTVGSGSLTLSNTTISHNTAKYRGGGIFHESTGNLTITGSTISYNSTDTDDGGGISCSGVCTVEITNSLFDNNYAALGGGGIYLGYGTITLTNTDVTNNTSHLKGGGILHNNNTPITITGGSISNNTAEDGYGGGFSKLDVSTVNISNATFDGNTSNNDGGNGGYGGAIYCENGSTFNLNNLTIKNNNAIYDGGGVYFNDGDITTTISNSAIHGNTAGNWGGGLALVAGNHEVTNSTIYNNNQTAAKGGGGIAVWDGTTALKNVSIVGNTSAGKGGGVYLEASSTLTVINTMIADNTAASGSDYYYDSGTLTDGGYNIVEDQAGASTGVNKTFTEATNITGQQANLFGTGLTTQTLADNQCH